MSSLVVTSALLLICTAVVSSAAAVRLRTQAISLQNSVDRAVLAEAATRSAKGRADLHLLESLRQQANALRRTNAPGQRAKSLETLRQAGVLLNSVVLSDDQHHNTRQALRNEAISCMALPDFIIQNSWPVDVRKNRSGVCLTTRRYAECDLEGNIHIYRIDDGSEVHWLPGDGIKPVRMPIFSPDGRFLAVLYGNNERFIVWRIEDSRPVISRSGFNGAFVFFPNSQAIAIGTNNGLQIYSTETAETIGGLTLPALAKGIAVHPNNSQITAVFRDKEYAIVYDLESKKVSRHDLPSGADSVEWNPSGVDLCVGLHMGDICIFNPEQPTATKRYLRGHTELVNELSFLHDGASLVSRGWDSTTRIWDIARRRQIMTVPYGILHKTDPNRGIIPFYQNSNAAGIAEFVIAEEPKSSLYGEHTLAIHPALPLVIVGGENGTADILHLKSMKRLARLSIAKADVFTGVSPSGDFVTSCENGIHIWPVVSSIHEIKVGPPALIRNGKFKRFEFNQSGTRVAVDDGSSALIIDLRDPKLSIRTGHHSGLSRVSLSPDGRFVATSAWKGVGVRIFDGKTGKPIKELLAKVETPCSVQFSPNGKTLVTGTEDAYFIWEVPTWKKTGTLKIPTYAGVASTASNSKRSWLALRMNRSVISLRSNDGEELAQFRAYPDSLVAQFTISRQGDFLVALTEHGCRSWDLNAVSRQLQELQLGPLDSQPLEKVDGRDVELPVIVDLGSLAETT